MTKLRKTELIVDTLFVTALVLLKVFVYLPEEAESEFMIGWFVALSFLMVPLFQLISFLDRAIRWRIHTDQWIEFTQLVNSILGIPFTIICFIASVYSLSLSEGETFLSVFPMTYPLFAFALYIGIKDRD